jgi:hypothetical protein
MTNGVRQGGNSSGKLFTDFFDILLKELEVSGAGCHLNGFFYGAIGYADDIALIAASKKDLCTMLKICESYSQRYHVQFNAKKSQFITFGRKSDENECVIFNGQLVKVQEKVSYLGYKLHCNSFGIDMQPVINDISAKCITVCNMFKHLNYHVKFQLFKTYAVSMYGCESWNYKSLDIVSVCWRKCIRQIYNLPYRTHCDLLPFVTESLPIEFEIVCRFVKFIQKCCRHENPALSNIARIALEGHGTTFSENVIEICKAFKLTKNDIVDISTANLYTKCETLFLEKLKIKKKINVSCVDLLKCLLHERENSLFLTSEEAQQLLEFVCLY